MNNHCFGHLKVWSIKVSWAGGRPCVARSESSLWKDEARCSTSCWLTKQFGLLFLVLGVTLFGERLPRHVTCGDRWSPRPVFVSFTGLSLTFPEIRLANVTTTRTKLGQARRLRASGGEERRNQPTLEEKGRVPYFRQVYLSNLQRGLKSGKILQEAVL